MDSDSGIDNPDIHVCYKFCKILSPTAVSIFMNIQQEILKNKLTHIKMDLAPQFYNINYSDIDFMYKLNKRYAQDIQPALNQMNEKIANAGSCDHNHDDDEDSDDEEEREEKFGQLPNTHKEIEGSPQLK